MKYFEKNADFSEWYKNRINDSRYLGYLLKHKYYVLKGGRELNVPLWPLIKHDWSKFKPSLWVPYRNAIYVDNVFEANSRKPFSKEFKEAIQKHKSLEEHHAYQLNKKLKPTSESFADWWSVQKSKNPDIPEIKIWLKNKGYI